ncbi:MAG TPA: exosortase/archaeosortase family protein [Gemmatimonadales bacterium]|nr:exosortase/archaeosortase family protein [Gemmatimonadales bacterium]
MACLAAAVGFVMLFWQPLATLGRDWWTDPESAHGLLLFPLALYLAWRAGLRGDVAAQPGAGAALLAAAVGVRWLSGLAAELFTLRLSMLAALAGLVVFTWGARQLRHWWLPASLLVLSIPIPAVVLGSLALPLQLEASRLGAWLLAARQVPVQLAGNVIQLPGHSLFVTEACSGLRSLTALIALGLLLGGLGLRTAWLRALLVTAAIPVALALNACRIFGTGFLVSFVDARFGDGFLHMTQGWALFVPAFAILAALARWLQRLEACRGRTA